MECFALQVEASEIIRLLAFCLKLLRSKIATNASVVGVTSGFGNDLHDAAGRLAFLRSKSARLNLHFFYEAQVDAGGKWTINAREDADAAEAAVCNADAVCDVVVFQSCSARDGRIGCASTAAAGNAGRCIEQTCHA